MYSETYVPKSILWDITGLKFRKRGNPRGEGARVGGEKWIKYIISVLADGITIYKSE
jgi:hypothetical protein